MVYYTKDCAESATEFQQIYYSSGCCSNCFKYYGYDYCRQFSKRISKEISEKIFGFWGHVRIYDYNSTMGFQDKAVSIHQKFYPSIEKMPGVKHIQVYANKPGIIKTKNEIESIVVRGYGRDFDTGFISAYAVRKNNSGG